MGDMYSGIDGGLETEELVNLFVAQKQSAKRCSQSAMVDDGMEWSRAFISIDHISFRSTPALFTCGAYK
jgi:hypothetical protein